eukprot:3967964-Amphidinium_carterae.4
MKHVASRRNCGSQIQPGNRSSPCLVAGGPDGEGFDTQGLRVADVKMSDLKIVVDKYVDNVCRDATDSLPRSHAVRSRKRTKSFGTS